MTTNISPFIQKLQQILNDQANSEIISFNEGNARLEISNKKKLENILPKYFRHGKFESFVRQLNWYGFYKINNKTLNCYSHPDLQKGNKLASIKSRRKNNSHRLSVQKNTDFSEAEPHLQDKPVEIENRFLTFFVPTQNQSLYSSLPFSSQYYTFDPSQFQLLNKFSATCPLYYSF